MIINIREGIIMHILNCEKCLNLNINNDISLFVKSCCLFKFNCSSSYYQLSSSYMQLTVRDLVKYNHVYEILKM